MENEELKVRVAPLTPEVIKDLESTFHWGTKASMDNIMNNAIFALAHLKQQQAQITQLQAEAVEMAAMLDKLEKMKLDLAFYIVDNTRCPYKHAHNEDGYANCKRCTVLYPIS